METIAIVGRTPALLLHAERYALLDDVAVRAVIPSDRSVDAVGPDQYSQNLAETLAGYAPQASIYKSLTNALAEDGYTIDGIDIAAPVSVAGGALDVALSTEVPILCTPPLVTKPDQIDDVRSRLSDSEAWVMNGNPHRFSRLYDRLQKRIEAGAIGMLGVARIRRAVPHRNQSWNAWYVEGGGLIDGVMAYDFDFLTKTFGPIKRVFSRVGDVESVAHTHTLLRFQSGATGQVEATPDRSGTAPTATIEFSGNYGRVKFSEEMSSIRYQKKGQRDLSIPTDDCYARMVRMFIEHVRDDEPPQSGVADALKTTRIVLAAERSAMTERPVNLEEVGK